MSTVELDALHAAVAGDVDAVRVLEALPDDQLSALGQHAALVIMAPAVARVLAEYEAGMWSPDRVQRWASFIRSGLVAGRSGSPIMAIDIAYEEAAEDAIVEAMSRLDELGDIIDGELRPGEAAELRRALIAASVARA